MCSETRSRFGLAWLYYQVKMGGKKHSRGPDESQDIQNNPAKSTFQNTFRIIEIYKTQVTGVQSSQNPSAPPKKGSSPPTHGRQASLSALEVAALKRILQKPPHSLEVSKSTKVLLLGLWRCFWWGLGPFY